MSEDFERRGSIIPPGYADVALYLASLPQPSEYDCGLETDQLVMAGLSAIAKEQGKTVEEVVREACYTLFRFYFASKIVKEQQGEG